MAEIVNIAGYKFVTLDELPKLRAALLEACRQRSIMGTILISPEGINLFLAAEREAIDSFLQYLRQDERLADFHVKESPSDRKPFNRLLVRIKKEIIAFGVDEIDPQTKTSPKLPAETLKQWLDEARPVTLLDVRNNYEVEVGTFENAVVADIDHFRQFPDAVARMENVSKEDPVVMFCTGGIRCEKAGPYMEKAGFRSIYQLDGGILQYFEDCGGEHYDGDCFVFDQRVAVNPELQETDAEVCFACQAVLKPEQLVSPQYQPGVSCPVCYRTEAEQQELIRKKREHQIAVATTPLPGSIPYDNYRPLNVPRRFDGHGLLDFLSRFHSHVPVSVWREKIQQGHLLFDGQALSEVSTVREGQRLEHLLPATVEPDVNAAIQILFEDDSLIVVNKPAPLPMHPSGRFNRNTLTWILGDVFEHPIRTAHRLDANTTGVVVFCKTRKVAAIVQPQFEKQQVEKQYLALVNGIPREEEFVVDLPITDQPTIAGGRRAGATGKESQTRFHILALSPEHQQALLKAVPLTGRTNQIRIHLWQTGTPIAGDPTYLPDRQMAETQTLSVTSPPMCLHAWRLKLRHPVTGLEIEFQAPLPEWNLSGQWGTTIRSIADTVESAVRDR